MTERKSTLHRSVKYPVWRGHRVWLSPPESVHQRVFKIRQPTMPSLVVRLWFFYPLRFVRFGSVMPLQMLWSSSQIEGICAPLPGGVANTAQSKMLGKRKRQKGISFFSPCRLFIYLANLYVYLDSPPPEGTGPDDTRRIPHLLKGSHYRL